MKVSWALLVLLLGAGGTESLAADADLVHSVRVDASDEERARLDSYVEIKVGEPLDPERVRHTVELIQATGAYADVRVEAEHTTDGLDVVVRPMPGPALNEVRVEGESPIDAGDVREITHLRPRDSLWPERLEAAAQAVAVRLAERGYAEARVNAEAVPSARRGADAVFHVKAGPRALVARTTIEGDVPSGLLLDLARPSTGAVWQRAAAQAAAEAMRRRLVREGHWRATVRAEDSYDPATAMVTLVFRVSHGPRMETEVRGATVEGDVRRAIERLLRENAARSDAVDEASDKLEESLRRLGHRDARATTREETSGDNVRVVFDVEPGPATTISTVRVVGETDAPVVALLSRAGEPLRDRDLDEDVRTLTRALEEVGHSDARVDVEVPERSGVVPVTFRLRAGPRTEIGAVDVVAPIELKNTATRELRTRTGRPYRARDMLVDRNTVLAAYRNAGYLQAEVVSHLQFSDDRTGVDVRFQVNPGIQTRVDHVVISGLQWTREEIVRRELQLTEGAPLGLDSVLESQRRLGSLGVFGNVTITEIDPESSERRSLLVRVEELPRAGIAYGVGYSERDGPRLSAEVTRRNIGGRDRSVTTFVRGSFRGLRLLTTYREPYLFGHRQEFFITGFREEEERDTFDYVRYGLLFEAARRLNPAWSLIARYTTQETRSFDIKVAIDQIDKQYLTATFSGPSLSLVHDSRDDPLDPHRGRFITADAQLSHRFLGGDSFVKGFLQAANYRRLTSHLVVATSARLGLARTLQGDEPDRLPFPDRFFAGGDYTLRGFELDRAGPLEPSSDGRLAPTGGNALVLAGAELRLDAGRYFGVALFSDAGQVYPLTSDIDLTDVRYTAGLGLRYKSAFGPIRLDWGYKLNRRNDPSASRFHFTIGHAF
jgi:outer membrane protein insertion porin family